MKKQIAVIDPAVNIAETDCFNRLQMASPLPLTYHLPKLGGMDSLEHLQGKIAGIIILGSSSSVNDAQPWQKAMNGWLLPKMQSGIPTLGLCYGHQLIAHLFGGKVDFLFPDHHKLSGFRKITLKPSAPWNGRPAEGPLVVSHREGVVQIPPDFELLGKTPEVPVEGIHHTKLPIWGLQSHPEATVGFLKTHGIPEPKETTQLDFGHTIVEGFLALAAKMNA